MDFPFEIKEFDEETGKKLREDFLSEKKSWLQVGPKKYCLQNKFKVFGPKLYNFQIRPTDVITVTFPRSGTTLTQEMIYLLVKDLDYEAASKVPQIQRFPQIEHMVMVSDEVAEHVVASSKGNPAAESLAVKLTTDVLQILENTPGQRFIKTHVPFSLLPPDLLDICKVVYVCRNPKDVIVSFYHLSCTLITFQYQNDFETFYDHFEKGQIRFCPYWEHLREAWERKDHPNMLFLFYEDIINDMKTSIRKIAAHYGKKVTDQQVDGLAEHLSIDNFRKNKAVNVDSIPFARVANPKASFIREGKVGKGNEFFTPELNARADKWIAENMARIPGFLFPSAK